MLALTCEASDTFYALSRSCAINRADLIWAVLKGDPSGALGIFILTISAWTLSQISLGSESIREIQCLATSLFPLAKKVLLFLLKPETTALLHRKTVFKEVHKFHPWPASVLLNLRASLHALKTTHFFLRVFLLCIFLTVGLIQSHFSASILPWCAQNVNQHNYNRCVMA